MKLTIIFQPEPVHSGKDAPNMLAFLEVQDEAGNTITEQHPALDWIADGDHEAVVIDTDKLSGVAAPDPTSFSTYPNDVLDRHGALRGVPACDWTCRNTASYTPAERGLASSLVPYVSGDDVDLTRKQFLQTVIDRIQSDLDHDTA